MTIHYIEHADIDYARWDQAIDQAQNGLPYTYSWYLDIVSDHWDALVSDDYTYVMALPWNAKWLGLKQIYQPFFTQQLGIFGSEEVTADIAKAFIKSIPPKFKYVSICLNEKNPIDLIDDGLVKKRSNMILDLSDTHDEIKARYRPSLRKRIKHAHNSSALKKDQLTPDELTDLYKAELNSKIGLPDEAFVKVKHLMEMAKTMSKGKIYSVYTDGEELLAAVFFLKSHGRVINLFGTSTPLGRDVYGMHWLLDQVIQEHSDTDAILDFEGSELPSVAHFFEGYRPRHVKYYHLVQGNTPRWVLVAQQLKNMIR